MADFPGQIPNLIDLDGQQTLAANNHSSRHNKVHRELKAVAERVGINDDTNPDSHDKKIRDIQSGMTSLSGEISDLQDYIDTTVMAAIATAKAEAKAEAKEESYPVGSLYYNADDSTNPEDLLGFGTWEAYAQGRVPVGIDPSDSDFDTPGETGGEKSHTMTINELVPHKHNFGQRPRWWGDDTLAGTTGSIYSQTSTTQQYAYRSDGREMNNTGGGAPFNVMQPYITVYVWRRTS